jgi:hypothetical protein
MRITYPEFRSENLDSRYPFADTATLLSRDKLAIDPAMLIDAVVYPIGAAARLYISTIEVSNRLVTIWIGDSTQPQLASGSFDPLAPLATIVLTDPYGRPAGMFVTDPILLASAQAWPSGAHTFDIGSTEFAASCTIATPEAGVRGLITAQGPLAAGDVWLVGEGGIMISLDEDGSIRVDVVGDPLFARRLCTPVNLFAAPRFVQTINGVPPGPDGDFQIAVATASAADTVLRIIPQPPDTLRIGLVGRSVQGG